MAEIRPPMRRGWSASPFGSLVRRFTFMIELTNVCNLRCKMCGIWSERPNIQLPMERYRELLGQPLMRQARVIALTGGEPFALEDFGDYYELARQLAPRAHVNISTNGWYTERTMELLRDADTRSLSITVSYDGVYSHDEIRGVQGSRERLVETARQIRAGHPHIDLSLKLTATNDNYAEILDTAKQCRELGIPFRFKTLEKLECHQSRSPSEIGG